MITKESRDARYRLRLNIHCRETGHLLEANPAIYTSVPIDTKRLLTNLNQVRRVNFSQWCFDTKKELVGIKYPADGIVMVMYETITLARYGKYNPIEAGDILIPLLELSPTFHDLCVSNDAYEEIVQWRKVW